MKVIQALNPGKNYELIAEVQASSPDEIKQKVAAANAAKQAWKETPIAERIAYLRQAREIFWRRKDEIADLITQEIGMCTAESRNEVEWDFGYFDWFLDNAEEILKPELAHQDENTIHEILYEPIGTAAVITPWNLPFDLFVWGVIPNLLAGNPVIHKASEECVLTGKLLAEIMDQVDLPDGVFNAIHGDGAQGEQLVNEDIDLIWFTGSSAVGKKLNEIAGRKFIRALLEMGGSNPGIVFEDADIHAILPNLKFERFSFAGQTCDAVKRLLVHESIKDEMVEAMKKEALSILVSDPADPETQMGSLAAKRQVDLLIEQVKDAVNKGARVITGGKQPEGIAGAYYLATILTNITPDMRVWTEEVFGPVLPVVSFKTEKEALKLANDTVYGLGASVYTQDEKRALRVASKIQAGNVCLNGVNHFIPQNPFGGYKSSGLGREHGVHGMRELCQVKVVARKK